MPENAMMQDHDSAARVAVDLARDLWLEETGRDPKASDADFIALVAICAMASAGRTNPRNLSSMVESFFPGK